MFSVFRPAAFLLVPSLLALCSCGTQSHQYDAEPPADGILLSGDISRPGNLTRDDITSLVTPTTISWTHHDETHDFTGVKLIDVLEARGYTTGERSEAVPKTEKRSGWKYVLVASSPDGFQAVFSCAELHDLIGNTEAWLVWEKDGMPLPEEEGPFRIVVPTDKEGARSLYHLTNLTLVDERKIVPPMNPGE